MEWVGPLQLNSHLVQRGSYSKRLWVELRKFSNANLCKLSDSSLNIHGVVKMWYLFSFSFLYFYIYIFFRFFLHSIAFSWFIRALPVYAWFNFTCCLPPPGNPRATPGTSPALLARGWGGPIPGVGGWGKSKISSLWFCEVRACQFSRGLHDSYTMAIFKEKRRNFLESGWRGITYQN